MNLYHHRRPDSSLALYIDGNLQFDTRDEAVYHESLALPALCLAKAPRTALICGGGDGLALREVLRFPGIEQVTLIDCSPEVLDFARQELSDLNGNSLDDPRLTLIVADALEAPLADNSFDVIICDFTFPTTKESALGFTVEWYSKLKAALTEGGVLVINTVSPQNTASAFACLVSTIRAAGLNALPYRVCIPSFRDHGYGAWGFILAAKHRLTISSLRGIECPVPTQQADLTALARAARFSVKARIDFAKAPVNRSANPVLQSLLLNPEARATVTDGDAPPDFPNLANQVEISHPYHSRSMIAALAEQVVGSLPSIDLRKLVDELALRAKELPKKIVEELNNLRAYLSRTVLDLDVWGTWASRLLATLILVMVIANSISPDPAFAKGGEGMGHASFSRGFSSHAEFGQISTPPSAPISGRGFTASYGHDPVDIYGYHYTPRFYFYGNGGGYYGGGGGSNQRDVPNRHKPKTHKPLFVLDDDLMAMDNGDFVISLSETAFLVIAEGQVSLMDTQGGAPLTSVFAEPKLFESIRKEVTSQTGDIDREVQVRKDWLSWVGWTSSMFSSVRSDTEEYTNLKDLQRRLGLAMKRLGMSPEAGSIEVPTDAIELFVGCHVLADNRVALYTPGGHPTYLDGTSMISESGKKEKLKPQLKAAIVSILQKMVKEAQRDIKSDEAEIKSLGNELASTQLDLNEYQSIQQQNGFDPSYEVDYGTDSIPVTQAIEKTQQDMTSIALDQKVLEVGIQKSQRELERFQATLQAWSQ